MKLFMKNKRPKIIYYKESQVLSWELSNGKSVDSDIDDNVVIGYAKNGKIVRINFYNFSLENFKKHKAEFKQLHNLALQVR